MRMEGDQPFSKYCSIRLMNEETVGLKKKWPPPSHRPAGREEEEEGEKKCDITHHKGPIRVTAEMGTRSQWRAATTPFFKRNLPSLYFQLVCDGSRE